MKYVTLKDTDLLLSNICLGGGSFGDKLNREQAFEIMDAYVREGGNFIDTANVYCRWLPERTNCSEQIIGEWQKSRGAYKNVTIATKGGHFDIDTKANRVNEQDIRKDLEESLKTLGLDIIDFYWLHRDDPTRPVEEIIDILESLRREGKIRYYGLSNYRTDRLIQAQKYLEAMGKSGPFGVSNQWSLASINPGKNANPDPTMVEFSEEEYRWHEESKVPVIPYSSTAMGFFEKLKKAGVKAKNGQLIHEGALNEISPSMRRAYLNEQNLNTYEKLLVLQQNTGHTLQALSVAWLLNQPFQVIPIGSARNTEQLKGLLEASEIKLDRETISIYHPQSALKYH